MIYMPVHSANSDTNNHRTSASQRLFVFRLHANLMIAPVPLQLLHELIMEMLHFIDALNTACTPICAEFFISFSSNYSMETE